MIPQDLLYTADHEWVRPLEAPSGAPARVRVGITDYAQQALGDIVFVSGLAVGAEVSAGTSLAEVESTTSVSDVYAPVAGTIVARNEALDAAPELVNADPYGEGWLAELELAGEALPETLLSPDAYGTHVEAAG
jgi:glycine cleavage system H protein